MAGHNSSISSPKLSTSFPKLFSFKSFSESAESMMSPTSILDTKSFSALKNPFYPSSPKAHEHDPRRLWVDSKGIVDALPDIKPEPNLSKPETRMVLFGSQLKIQIPPLPLASSLLSPTESSPKSSASPADDQENPFSSRLSPSPVKKLSLFGSPNSGTDTPNSPQFFTEMELSEDYTCVISHGPNPVTTHIFDNCIIQSCCGVVGSLSAAPEKENGFPGGDSSYPSDCFLSCCDSCKKNLGQGQDIYMYRGEKAFCSEECRYREILFEEEMDNL